MVACVRLSLRQGRSVLSGRAGKRREYIVKEVISRIYGYVSTGSSEDQVFRGLSGVPMDTDGIGKKRLSSTCCPDVDTVANLHGAGNDGTVTD